MNNEFDADPSLDEITARRGLRRARLIVIAECVVLAGVALLVIW